MFRFFGQGSTERKNTEQRQEELRAILQGETSRESKEAQKAIAYCEYCINTYEGWFELNETKWLRWQKVVIIGGVVATLSGVMTIPPEWVTWLPGAQSLGWVRGVPAAIVTIAAGFMGSFTYREDAVRHELTANSLWNELARFQGGADPYDKGDAPDTSLFLNAICRIVENELRSWSALVMGSRPETGKSEKKEGTTIVSH